MDAQRVDGLDLRCSGTTATKPYYTNGQQSIYLGDFREVLLDFPTSTFEACITDPPYPKAYQHLYGDLAILLPRLLKRGGSFLSIVPHYSLHQVIPEVSKSLKWRWILAMWQAAGVHARMAMGVEVLWKPVGWWVNEAWPTGRGFVKDGFENSAPAKQHHKWEQHKDWANYCLSFVPPHQPVLDPFVGSGTLLLSAHAQGRPAVGIDIDESACETAAKRLDQLSSPMLT